jgi:oligoendopeptidase F
MRPLLLALALAAAAAEAPFEPFPAGREAYHLDFARVFPPEARQREELEHALTALQARRGRATRSAPALEAALRDYGEALRAYERLDADLYLRAAIDTTDGAARDEEERISVDFEKRTSFFLAELRALAPGRRARFLASSARLRQEAFFLSQAGGPHPPSEAEERVLAAAGPLATSWPQDLYHLLEARVTAPRPDPGADAAAREGAFRARCAQLASDRDLYALALLRLAHAGNTLARLRGYEDAAAEAYGRSQLTKAGVGALLDQIAAAAPLYTAYQELRASQAGPNVWDVGAGPPDAPRPRFTIEEARELIPRALAPLGPRYVGALRLLLDPAQGRLDVVAGPHRRRGGFSKGFPGFPSVFYMGGFTGAYNDVRVITHESTHAMQRQLQAEAGVSPLQAGGAKFLAEAFAMLNELLLPEHLYAREADPGRRRFYLEQLLESKGIAIVFGAASEAALEQSIYEAEARGELHTADDLDALTLRVASRYSIWPRRHPELRMQWMQVPLMYEDPFYDVNYAYAGLLALELHARAESDPRGFMPRYLELMAHGSDAPPAELLRRLLGVDLQDPGLARHALSTLEPRIAELTALYDARR